MEFIKNFIFNIKQLPDESMDSFLSIVKVEKCPKHYILSKINKVPEDFFILKTGIVRSFYTNNKNREFTRTIFTSNSTTGALNGLLSNTPSKLEYSCLTACEVYRINFKKFKELTQNDPHILEFYAKVLENIFLILEARIYELSVLNATERYLKLQKQIPGIENLIPQYQIASYLNITPVQLSRIRKEILCT